MLIVYLGLVVISISGRIESSDMIRGGEISLGLKDREGGY